MAGNRPFWTEDIIAAVILAATGGTALLLNMLDDLALTLNFPILHELVQWWPALLIVAGLILLLANQSSKTEASLGTRLQKTDMETTNEYRP